MPDDLAEQEKDLEYWLEQNPILHDPLPENRCVELPLENFTRTQILQHIQRGDYLAAHNLANGSSELFDSRDISALRGADHRSRFELPDAKKRLKEAGMEGVLAPPGHHRFIEYYLSMKWRASQKDFASLMLSITPLLFELGIAHMEKAFQFDIKRTLTWHCRNAILERKENLRYEIEGDEFHKYKPAVYEAVKEAKKGYLPKYWTNDLIVLSIEHLYKADPTQGNASLNDFTWLRDLDKKRNQIAHQMKPIKEADIVKIAECSIDDMFRRIEEMIRTVLEINPKIFDSYDDMDKELIQRFSPIESQEINIWRYDQT